MTNTIIIGNNVKCKKAYSVYIQERVINKNGKVTGNSSSRLSFQVRDISGKSNVKDIKKQIMECLK